MISTLIALTHMAWVPPSCAELHVEIQTVSQKSKDQLKLEKDIEDDKKQGKEASDYYDRTLKPTKDTASQQRVEEIGAKLALIANANSFDLTWGDKRHAEFEYKFKVVESKDINAFSLPGGYIYVYQGLVDFCQSDDELAGVLAHEINHAGQRHVAWLRKEQEKLAPIQIPLILASIFSGNASGIAGSQLLGTAVTNGWSVKAETSADYGGVQLMLAGGYDATGMLTFMERLQAKDGALDGAVDLGILRTHPPSKARAEKIEAFMNKNLIPIRRSLVSADFRVSHRASDTGAHLLYFGKRKLFAVAGGVDRANSLQKTLNSFFDRVPEMYEVTTGDEGVIYAKNRALVTVTPEDAKANGMEIEQLQNAAAKAIRSSIFSLAYHIWEGRN
jgi:predicted Zn-dependent protease